MREIKFRAWDNKKKKMLDGTGNPEVVIVAWDGAILPMYTSSDITGEYYSHVDLEDETWQSDIILMQYTGLLDKNGVEIYEGDIITSNLNENLEVIWNEDRCSFEMRGRYEKSYIQRQLDCDIILDANIKVIGNIYENPELMECQ